MARNSTPLRELNCGQHGKRPWKGHVMCSECGEVYQTHDEKAEHFAPLYCKCGERLMPRKAGDKFSWSARSICESCYADRIKKP